MNLNIYFDWKKIVKKAESIDYSASYFDLLGKKSRWIIFVALLLMAGFCGRIWYEYVYSPSWSDEQKKAYINSKGKGVLFNRSKFDEIIGEQEKRKKDFDKNIEDLKDIFKLEEREIK
jgi:hypothetical protein